MVRVVARDGDASHNVVEDVADRAGSTLADIAATGRASERDWLVSREQIADLCVPSYRRPNADPLLACWKLWY